jgi:hypothetical protein
MSRLALGRFITAVITTLTFVAMDSVRPSGAATQIQAPEPLPSFSAQTVIVVPGKTW